MAKIDALLGHMTQHGATRALLQADAPATLETQAGTTQGQPLAGAQLQAMLDEIIPIEARQSLSENGGADFTYSAPSGPFNIRVSQPNGNWHLEVQPATVPLQTTIAPVVENIETVPTDAPAVNIAPVVETIETVQAEAPAVNIAKESDPLASDAIQTNVQTPATPPQSPATPVAPAPYAPPSSGQAGGAAMNAPNDSGMGDASVLPAELRGFNWGALFGSWIWGIGNSVWLGLLGLVPCVGFFMRFYLGSKGNELAWKSKRWDSVQAFRSAQTTWAIVGIALIGASLFGMLMMSAILFPVFARARENARRASCQQNLKQISLAALQFSQEHKDRLPTGTTMAQWKPQLKPYLGTSSDQLFVCPSHAGAGESYEVNPDLSGADITKLDDPAQTPMFTEPKSDLHLDGSNIAFADGHIKAFRDSTAADIAEKEQVAP